MLCMRSLPGSSKAIVTDVFLVKPVFVKPVKW